jgi:hypothetical protein
MALTIGQAVVELAVNSAKFRDELGKARNDFNKFADQIRGAAQLVTEALGAISIAAMVRDAIAAGNAIGVMSQRLGIGAEALQELQHAARATGADIGQLETGLDHLQRRMAEAAQGTPEAARFFKDLGLNVMEADDSIKSLTAFLPEFASAISLKGQAEQTRAIWDAMGRGAQALLPMLKEGADGLKAFGAEAREVGTISESGVMALREMKERAELLATALQVDVQRALIALQPLLKTTTSGLLQMAEAIGHVVNRFVEMKNLEVEGLKERIDQINKGVESLRQHIEKGPSWWESFLAGGREKAMQAWREAMANLQKEGADALTQLQKLTAPAPKTGGPIQLTTSQLQSIDDFRFKLEQLTLSGNSVALQLASISREAERLKETVPRASGTIDDLARKMQAAVVAKDVQAGLVAMADAIEQEDLSLLKVLEELADQQVATEKAAAEMSAASWVAAIDEQEAAETAAFKVLEQLTDERVAYEQKAAEESAAGWVKAIDEQLAAEEDGLREIARIQDEEARKFREQVKGFIDPIGDAFIISLDGVIRGTQTLDQALRNLGQNIGLSYLQKGIKAALDAITDEITQFLQSAAFRDFVAALARLGLSALSAVGIGGTVGPYTGTGTAFSTVGSGAEIPAFQHGGVVSGPTLAMVGEGGPEAIVPLHALGGGGNVTVQIFNQTGSGVVSRTEQGRGPNGQKTLKIWLTDAMNDIVGSGGIDKTAGLRYGLRPRGVSR